MHADAKLEDLPGGEGSNSSSFDEETISALCELGGVLLRIFTGEWYRRAMR
jgi:hypothetical protein